jgi:hypothetical protein
MIGGIHGCSIWRLNPQEWNRSIASPLLTVEVAVLKFMLKSVVIYTSTPLHVFMA